MNVSQSNTVGWASAISPFRLLTMYSRSRLEMRRCSAGVLLVRSIHSIIVIVDVIPAYHTHGESLLTWGWKATNYGVEDMLAYFL